MTTFAKKHMAQYPARPKATPEILLQAGQEIEDELKDWANWKDQCQGLAQALAKISGSQHMNGYELAKELESNYLLMQPNAELVETLDSFGFEVSQILDELAKQWERDNNVQPPHPMGTQLKEGVITGISSHHAAAYLVDIGEGTSRRVIEYEDAVTAEEAREVTPA